MEKEAKRVNQEIQETRANQVYQVRQQNAMLTHFNQQKLNLGQRETRETEDFQAHQVYQV
jgi:hypothetical protein